MRAWPSGRRPRSESRLPICMRRARRRRGERDALSAVIFFVMTQTCRPGPAVLAGYEAIAVPEARRGTDEGFRWRGAGQAREREGIGILSAIGAVASSFSPPCAPKRIGRVPCLPSCPWRSRSSGRARPSCRPWPGGGARLRVRPGPAPAGPASRSAGEPSGTERTRRPGRARGAVPAAFAGRIRRSTARVTATQEFMLASGRRIG